MENASPMQLFQLAVQTAQQGDRAGALQHADRFAASTCGGFENAPAVQAMTMFAAPLGSLYEKMQEWELAALKLEDVCAFAEATAPDTAATAGDYAQLADVRTALGEHAGALEAWEASTRHLKASGEWQKYAKHYEQRHAELRKACDQDQ